MNADRLVALIILGCLLTCLFLLDDKVSKQKSTEETRFYRVDSISSRLKYEVMPEKIYTYHTAFGPISGPKDKYKVGDTIEIKIIRYEK
jgi:hypothetical protein